MKKLVPATISTAKLSVKHLKESKAFNEKHAADHAKETKRINKKIVTRTKLLNKIKKQPYV